MSEFPNWLMIEHWGNHVCLACGRCKKFHKLGIFNDEKTLNKLFQEAEKFAKKHKDCEVKNG